MGKIMETGYTIKEDKSMGIYWLVRYKISKEGVVKSVRYRITKEEHAQFKQILKPWIERFEDFPFVDQRGEPRNYNVEEPPLP